MSNQPENQFKPSPEYLAREKRFYDALALRKPDRVPVASLAALFVTRYAGLTNAEAIGPDYERVYAGWLASTKKLELGHGPAAVRALPSRR